MVQRTACVEIWTLNQSKAICRHTRSGIGCSRQESDISCFPMSSLSFSVLSLNPQICPLTQENIFMCILKITILKARNEISSLPGVSRISEQKPGCNSWLQAQHAGHPVHPSLTGYKPQRVSALPGTCSCSFLCIFHSGNHDKTSFIAPWNSPCLKHIFFCVCICSRDEIAIYVWQFSASQCCSFKDWR